MADNRMSPSKRSSQLQEAIDTIVQIFDHPDTIAIDHTFESGQKRTTFEIVTPEGTVSYELVYEGQDEKSEPELTRRGH